MIIFIDIDKFGVMKFGFFVKNKAVEQDIRYKDLEADLVKAGNEIYSIKDGEDLQSNIDMVLSVGGDGTFLSASKIVADSGVPILGVNMGRLGFLSENRPEDVLRPLLDGDYVVEDRALLRTCITGQPSRHIYWPYALNEVTVHRSGAAVVGINVSVDGNALPTYWADGMLVATASGSTAYSLSVGGPICMPDAKVLVIAPIAPHNLNVRPLVVPDTSNVKISVEARDDTAIMTLDNRTLNISASCILNISMAQFSLKRIRLNKSSFVKALTSKLFWGEDIRNNE